MSINSSERVFQLLSLGLILVSCCLELDRSINIPLTVLHQNVHLQNQQIALLIFKEVFFFVVLATWLLKTCPWWNLTAGASTHCPWPCQQSSCHTSHPKRKHLRGQLLNARSFVKKLIDAICHGNELEKIAQVALSCFST